ncbi:hypothetical protein GN330_10605 [Nitratireductor sp. CAU 1489]|uniref:Lipoprotein n=1 Tax=Nitratireductor arenosus TaxID=2682096 RepID=A0A844QCF0_9HYPH|nr:hypothetical protein [Nitratireductor arenosus]MVA97696.1 hypothetical protein [Nitratireductor arenosus]
MRPARSILLISAMFFAGCTSTPVKDSFSDMVDRLHAKNSPLRGDEAG